MSFQFEAHILRANQFNLFTKIELTLNHIKRKNLQN